MPSRYKKAPESRGSCLTRRSHRQHLARLEGLAHAWVPALEVLHLDVESLGDDVKRVTLLDLVLGLFFLALGLGVGRDHGVDAPGAALAVVLHHQGLADLEVLAGELVPALQVLDVDIVGFGNGAQVPAMPSNDDVGSIGKVPPTQIAGIAEKLVVIFGFTTRTPFTFVVPFQKPPPVEL